MGYDFYCCDVALGQMSNEETGRAFVGFARIIRLLDDNLAMPIDGEKMDSVYTPRRYGCAGAGRGRLSGRSLVSRVELNQPKLPAIV
jgi:hypothetical protein